MEVDAADDNHTDWDHNCCTAGNSAAYGAQQQQNNFHHKVNRVSGCLVRVSDSSKKRIVGRRFS